MQSFFPLLGLQNMPASHKDDNDGSVPYDLDPLCCLCRWNGDGLPAALGALWQ